MNMIRELDNGIPLHDAVKAQFNAEESRIMRILTRSGVHWDIEQARAVFFENGQFLEEKFNNFDAGYQEIKNLWTGIDRKDAGKTIPLMHPSYVLSNGVIMYQGETYPRNVSRPRLKLD
jgi:hypothetical protein